MAARNKAARRKAAYRKAAGKKAGGKKAATKKATKKEHPSSTFTMVLYAYDSKHRYPMAYKQIGPRAHKRDSLVWFNAAAEPLWIVFRSDIPVDGTTTTPDGRQGIQVPVGRFSTPVRLLSSAPVKSYVYYVFRQDMTRWDEGSPDGPMVDVDP